MIYSYTAALAQIEKLQAENNILRRNMSQEQVGRVVAVMEEADKLATKTSCDLLTAITLIEAIARVAYGPVKADELKVLGNTKEPR